MSLSHQILTSMHPKIIYRACDIAAANHMTAGEAGKILKLLVQGGMVDEIQGDGYRRKRLYQTKQKRLPL
ncbi:MAG: hypothetical protein ABW134_11610 [Candidatus Thiodiazotropha endolucinida]